MAFVRFRIACRARAEIHEVEASDIDIGRDQDASLRIFDRSIRSRHARVLLRRGRLLLADSGGRRNRTSRNGERVLAPVALAAGESFQLGDVTLAAWPSDVLEPNLARRALSCGRVQVEIDSSDPELRRYELAPDGGARRELVIASGDIDRERELAWVRRMRAGNAVSTHSLAPLIVADLIDGRGTLVEELPHGIRLDRLLDAIDRGIVAMPIEVAVAVLAHLAESAALSDRAIGPHGAIDPRSVHLGLDGSVKLLRPGPRVFPGVVRDELLSPERRFTALATTSGDVFAIGAIGKALVRTIDDCPSQIRAVTSWLAHADPKQRPGDLELARTAIREAGEEADLDPTFVHIARIVRLLTSDATAPLAEIPAHLRPRSRAGNIDPIR